MKKVKFLRDFFRHGKKYEKGTVHEFTQAQSDELVKRGVATLETKTPAVKNASKKETKGK